MKQPKPSKHICGQCQEAFSSEQGYLKHVCAASGATPIALNKSIPPKHKAVIVFEQKIL